MAIVRTRLISFTMDRVASLRKIRLGNESDNMVERLRFALPVIAEHQTATLVITGRADLVRLNYDDENGYYVDLTAEIVGPDGETEAYVRIDGDAGEAWSSNPFRLITGELPDVDEEIEHRFPGAVESMLAEMSEHSSRMDQQEERIEDAAKRAENAADRAENATVSDAVTSVNGKQGAVVLTAEDVKAVGKEELPQAINTALLQAKESGEFDGEQGPEGPQGADGSPGKSAYQYALEGGYTGTEEEFAAKLAEESYTLPAATADTLGGVKVGEGLQMDGDVLGVKSEGEYELIETITLTEDITAIARDVNLKAVLVLATFAKASQTTNAFLKARLGSVERVTGSNFIRADGVSSARFSVEKKGVCWDLSSNGYVRGWGSGQYYGQGNAADVVFVKDNPTITNIRLYASDGAGVIPNGSIIEVWGVRANA